MGFQPNVGILPFFSSVSRHFFCIQAFCLKMSNWRSLWRSPKSAEEVTNAFSLVCHFQKGISCWGKYVFFGWPPLEVTFGRNINQLQRSQMDCHWLAVFKKVSCRSKYVSCGCPQLEVTFGYHKTAAEVNNTLTLVCCFQ